MSKLYEVEHDENFSMTPEQFKLNLARKITRLNIMSRLHKIDPCEEEVVKDFD